MSNFAKRNFALAKESGKKAARWIRQQHPDLFQHRVAQPPIEVFKFLMCSFHDWSNVFTHNWNSRRFSQLPHLLKTALFLSPI